MPLSDPDVIPSVEVTLPLENRVDCGEAAEEIVGSVEKEVVVIGDDETEVAVKEPAPDESETVA